MSIVILSLQNGLDIEDVVTTVPDGFPLNLDSCARITIIHPMKIVQNKDGISIRLVPLSIYGSPSITIVSSDIRRYTMAAPDLSEYYNSQVRRLDLLNANPEAKEFLKKLLAQAGNGNIGLDQIAEQVTDLEKIDETEVAIEMAESNVSKTTKKVLH